ncbi:MULTISPECIES: uracil-DNA glycosylase [unclassified Roseateles]|uniref:uracil-DNA glycosylase n=1 Tax=unclassified Roseateles TaxID=2626991 RepID=UPI0022B87673|nr:MULTISPECIES: uracil-DNA glycosylase [unclassified Roseateles]MCZ7880308.1 uracil-DNA glycosylase [Paucibacter sp. M5-1]MDC6168309.1 uracil-DNA glycosylase [Paucibacter sp. XJ19-41]
MSADAVSGGWAPIVEAWRASPAGQGLEAYLAQRRAAGATIYPPEPYRALQLTPLDQVKVVILGQDPYHGPGQAEGLSFSVPRGLKKLPPSLRNIYKELQRDLGLTPPAHGHLATWAERGVLLLNTCLTVEDGAPASHAKRGWEALTDALIRAAAADAAPKVFMLWGAHAQAKAMLIAAAGPQHLILQSNHPSPLSATRPPLPFIGCGHFSRAAQWLAEQGRALEWRLPE